MNESFPPEPPAGRDERPDFDGLFLVGDGGEDAYGWFTPRLAARLWLAAVLLADEHIDDAQAYEPRLPPIARGRGTEFAARLQQAAGDLRDDIARGQPPLPRSTGEAVVLGWIMDEALATASGEDDSTSDLVAELLEPLSATTAETTDARRDVSNLYDALFEDLDFETLYSPDLDGIDTSERGRELGMESLRPADWFVPYTHLADVLPPRPEPVAGDPPTVFTLESKVTFRVTDAQAVHDAAVAQLSHPQARFDSEDARREEITRVQLSLTDALLTLADPSKALGNIPGVHDEGSVTSIEPGDTTP